MAEEDKKEEKRFNIYTVIKDILTGKTEKDRADGNIFEALGLKEKKKDKKDTED